ncbi:MAG TPA: hypothetical protein VGO96_21645 [Pyrinomonadaceae bacterium]|jgi:hypothetical protein|nr:hypothetical protein [Pyrinomonadaceae bacterium]
MRRSDDDTAQPDAQALEQLQISRLLLAEASAKRISGEIIEAMELREEARARRRHGLSMLAEATTGEPQSLVARR